MGGSAPGTGGVAAGLFSGTPASGARMEVEGVRPFACKGDRAASESAFRHGRSPSRPLGRLMPGRSP